MSKKLHFKEKVFEGMESKGELLKIKGNIVDIWNENTFHGEVIIRDGLIAEINPLPGQSRHYLMPGFVDAHIHIESSMLVPSEFARIALPFGTVATISDPHEIANVMGLEGVEFMIRNGDTVPLKFFFGAPSCVPATDFETSGARISASDIFTLLQRPEIKYMSEMMNYPGVIHEDPQVIQKIKIAQSFGKPVDGHAPGLRGEPAVKYFNTGISTDHECYSYEEGLEKAKMGVKIIVREGSAAKNFNELIPLLRAFPSQIMLCSDDKHPDELIKGHIDKVVKRAISAGYDLFEVLRAASLNPVEHYDLDVGLLRIGDPADLIVVNDLINFNVLQTYINGELVAKDGECISEIPAASRINLFADIKTKKSDFSIPAKGEIIRVIEPIDGQLITKEKFMRAKILDGHAVTDLEQDILKLSVVNRYKTTPPALAFVHGFGMKKGAIASSVGHDSHNVLAVGVDDDLLSRAVNLVCKNKGGISAVDEDRELILSLPVAGLMSDDNGHSVSRQYSELEQFVRHELCSTLNAPFMTLSFLALLVIPKLKLSDRGLFDGETFAFTSLFA